MADQPQSSPQPQTQASTSTPAANSNSNNNNQKKKNNNNNRRRFYNKDRKPVAKPKPKNQDKLGKRQVEINQIKRGFPQLIESENGVAYKLKLKPTDPDFPYDINELIFNLFVPTDYPQSQPYIAIQNTDIPRGYAANVESGFRQMAQRCLNRITLLDMTVQLDKHLEEYLSKDRQETMKVVRHRKSAAPAKTQQALPDKADKPAAAAAPASAAKSNFSPRKNKVFIPKQVKEERQRQIDQLKHRVKGCTLFNQSQEGSTFSITITPPHSEIIPEELTHFRCLLYIPSDYKMTSSCTIRIPSVDDIAARNIEQNFDNHSKNSKHWSLVALLNYLSTQVERLMLSPHMWIEQEPEPEPESEKDEDVEIVTGHVDIDDKKGMMNNEATSSEKGKEKKVEDDEDASVTTEIAENTDTTDTTTDKTNVFDEMPPLDLRGTALILPNLKLSHIGFLECHTLNLVVKCSRCKTTNDILNLVSAPYGRDSKAHGTGCSKCNQTLAAAFRKDFIHPNNNRVGLFDFSNCEPFSLLPSAFTPTCEKCSTTLPHSFKKMEIGKPCYANCRECHAKMTMFMPEYRFDLITENSMGELKLKVKKNKKESLGIVGGSPLPNEGTCSHYKKSNRWMRFSCCGKVHACDKCHDEKSDHPNERAHRMICGKCSREQNFGGVCVYCRHTFDTRHSGFWEGGTGERNKARLSRKDPRKYSRKGVRNSAKKS